MHNSRIFSCSSCKYSSDRKINVSVHTKLRHTKTSPTPSVFQLGSSRSSLQSSDAVLVPCAEADQNEKIRTTVSCGASATSQHSPPVTGVVLDAFNEISDDDTETDSGCSESPQLMSYDDLGTKDLSCKKRKIGNDSENLKEHRLKYQKLNHDYEIGCNPNSEDKNKPTAKNLYSCIKCSYKSEHMDRLNRHIASHNKFLECGLCNYKCKYKASLIRHERIHNGDKPFICQYCEYRSTQSGALKRHERTHTGEKPYKCQHCEYRCTSRQGLNRHEGIHKGKPFKCPQCDFKYGRKDYLTKHLQTHQG